ncbi:uncharacterized protein LOC105767010 [Gossypium raimondii]|uniref:uncharacterized protein LOC105767010 n=1 Tax=Gossypium raimondii TaxID=29730 RepID=UPI00063B06A7|nr:uncharacterized protein LOC105767010 [Gossypium raimondii]
MSNYAKFIKDILSKKRRLGEFETTALTKECIAFLQYKLLPKMKDTGSFTIPCYIGGSYCGLPLCDLGESINLTSMSMFKQLGIGEVRPTTVTLQLADRSIAYPEGKIEYVLLGKAFLGNGRTLIDVQKGELTIRVQDDQVTFNVFKSMRFPNTSEEYLAMSEIKSLVSAEWDLNSVNGPLQRILASDPLCDNKRMKVWPYWKLIPIGVSISSFD